MGNNIDRRTVHPPLFISARLMAAAKLADGSVLHVEWSGKTDSAGRAGVHYVIEDGEGIVLADSADLHVRGGYSDALESLCTFLGAAAEAYRGVGLDRARLAESENGELFPPECTEWAYQNEDEISMLAGSYRGPIGAEGALVWGEEICSVGDCRELAVDGDSYCKAHTFAGTTGRGPGAR